MQNVSNYNPINSNQTPVLKDPPKHDPKLSILQRIGQFFMKKKMNLEDNANNTHHNAFLKTENHAPPEHITTTNPNETRINQRENENANPKRTSVGAKFGMFAKGALAGLVHGAFFVAAKPGELVNRQYENMGGIGDNVGTLKGQLKTIDNEVLGEAKTGAEKGLARAGGALGGLVGGAIGVGVAAFTGIYALVKAIGKGVTTIKENVQQNKTTNEKDVNKKNEKGWDPAAVFKNKNLCEKIGKHFEERKGGNLEALNDHASWGILSNAFSSLTNAFSLNDKVDEERQREFEGLIKKYRENSN